jgi:hypothetical protein
MAARKTRGPAWRMLEEMETTATTQEDETPESDAEDLAVWQWRAEQLHRLGLSWLLARVFAAVVDWHEFANLVERGCSPELALEIVR